MAFTQIAGIAPNYRDYKNWWLKAYEPGTTTPKLMSDNDTGSPTSAKYELNKDGFIISSGGTLITPHIDGDYDLWLFPTEAEADTNDTTNAERLADDLENYLTNTSLGNSIGGFVSYEFDTVADAKIGLTIGEKTVTLEENDVIRIKERDSALFDVISGTGTANGFDIIAHATLDLSFSVRASQEINAVQWGAIGDNSFDNTSVLTRVFNQATSLGIPVLIPDGTYLVTSIQITIQNSLHIKGCGRNATVIKKSNASSSNILQFEDGSVNCSLRSLSVFGDFTNLGIGGQGIVVANCSNWFIHDCRISDVASSGVIIFTTGGGREQNNIIDNCEVFGKGNTKNGLLIVDCNFSGIQNCNVYNVTEFALELKNDCKYSWIRGGSVDGCDLFAIAFGQTSGVGPSYCSASDITVKATDGLIELSNGSFNDFTNITCDFDGNPGTLNGCINCSADVTDSSFRDIKVDNLPTAIFAVRFRENNARNFVHFSGINKTGSGDSFRFDATSEECFVDVDLYTVNQVVQDDLSGFISGAANSPSSLVNYKKRVFVRGQDSTSNNTGLGDITADINTINKFTGKMVFNVSSNRPVWASGSAPADVWLYSDGTTSNTPS